MGSSTTLKQAAAAAAAAAAAVVAAAAVGGGKWEPDQPFRTHRQQRIEHYLILIPFDHSLFSAAICRLSVLTLFLLPMSFLLFSGDVLLRTLPIGHGLRIVDDALAAPLKMSHPRSGFLSEILFEHCSLRFCFVLEQVFEDGPDTFMSEILPALIEDFESDLAEILLGIILRFSAGFYSSRLFMMEILFQDSL